MGSNVLLTAKLNTDRTQVREVFVNSSGQLLVSGGGGGGDASAANQVTGNNSLASIDTKTPSLSTGRVPVESIEIPTGVAANALTPSATAVAASSLVLKASAGNLYGVQIATGGTAGYLMLFNAVAAPADGVVTPIKVYSIAANASLEVGYDIPLRFGTGITAVFSSTGPFTKTASATAFISGEVV